MDPVRGKVENPGRRGRGSNERSGKVFRGGDVEDPMRGQLEDPGEMRSRIL